MSRGEATRDALVRAGRELIAERGYAAVGTEEIVERAGVTRGALYHHFVDKQDLFRTVHEELEQRLVADIGARIGGIEDPWELMETGVRAFLDACTDPAIMRIALLDAPAVLGWRQWREISERYGMGLVTFALQNAMDAGLLALVQPEGRRHRHRQPALVEQRQDLPLYQPHGDRLLLERPGAEGGPVQPRPLAHQPAQVDLRL